MRKRKTNKIQQKKNPPKKKTNQKKETQMEWNGMSISPPHRGVYRGMGGWVGKTKIEIYRKKKERDREKKRIGMKEAKTIA